MISPLRRATLRSGFSSEAPCPSSLPLEPLGYLNRLCSIWGIEIMRAFATIILCLAAQAAMALEPQSINKAQWGDQTDKGGMNPAVAKAQILLGRAHFSPGEID